MCHRGGVTQQNIIDNYVWEGHGVQDNNAVRLYIGNKSGYKARAFIRFATMPTIPTGSTITAATMTVNGEETGSGFTDNAYYNLSSSHVQDQIAAHGEY